MMRIPRLAYFGRFVGVSVFLALACSSAILGCETSEQTRYCVDLAEALDLAEGNVWRCPAEELDDWQNTLASGAEMGCMSLMGYLDECVGPPAEGGHFACGPDDCVRGTVCQVRADCARRNSYACVEPNPGCDASACGCVRCSSNDVGGCTMGELGDPWAWCVETFSCSD